MARFALIGCGAAVEQLHLPALVSLPEAQVTWIVDVQQERAWAIARRYGISNVTDDYTQVVDVEAVLIGTPHHLHAPMADFFLQRGVHVLCEKPLAIKAAEVERLVTTARAKNLTLAVGVFRRYYPVSRFFKRIIEAEWLGAIERIDAEEGTPFDWPLQSFYLMDRSQAGGGVLIDAGSHTLDRLLWWFGGSEITLESYCDNSASGVETDCEMRFSILWRGRQIPIRVELSRTRTLRNTFQVFMSSGMVESPVNHPTRAWFVDKRLSSAVDPAQPVFIDLTSPTEASRAEIRSYFRDQLIDFCMAIRAGRQPLNAGETVLPVVRLIESCYAVRQDMPEPWVEFGLDYQLLNTEGAQT